MESLMTALQYAAALWADLEANGFFWAAALLIAFVAVAPSFSAVARAVRTRRRR
jgi:hypothetical protein